MQPFNSIPGTMFQNQYTVCMKQLEINLSQCDNIRRHLEDGRSITQLEALNMYGCFRLGARIYNLKEQGLSITMEWVRKGRKKFASYKLATNGNPGRNS